MEVRKESEENLSAQSAECVVTASIRTDLNESVISEDSLVTCNCLHRLDPLAWSSALEVVGVVGLYSCLSSMKEVGAGHEYYDRILTVGSRFEPRKQYCG